jgi:hypothetical protein
MACGSWEAGQVEFSQGKDQPKMCIPGKELSCWMWRLCHVGYAGREV